jgi:hypothetical protein
MSVERYLPNMLSDISGAAIGLMERKIASKAALWGFL